MKVRTKFAAVVVASFATFAVTAIPAQAWSPPIPLIIPAEAAVVTTGVGTALAFTSGVGEALALAYGVYYAASVGPKVFNYFFPKHDSTAADPDKHLSSSTSSGTHYYFKYAFFTPGAQTFSQLQDITVKPWTSQNYTMPGGGTIAGFTPVFDTGVSPNVSPGEFECGIMWRNSVGVVSYYASYVANTAADIGNGTAGQTGVTMAKCTSMFQQAITDKAINGTTNVLMNFILAGNTYFGSGTENNIPALNYTGIMGNVQVQAVVQSAYSTIICKDSSGVSHTYTGASVNLSSGVPMSSVTTPSCNAGEYTYEVSTYMNNNGVLQRTYDWLNNASASYPSCSGTVKCVLEVRYKTLSCSGNLSDACVNWYQNSQIVPADYSCYWGTYALPTLNSCSILKSQYDPTATFNADGIANSPAPSVVVPLTTDTGVGTSSLPTDTGWTGCAPSGWQLLNPFAYVGGTACLIGWAVVPPGTAFSDGVTTLNAVWTSSPVGLFTTAMLDVPNHAKALTGDGGVGCQGPTVSLPIGSAIGLAPTVFHPLAACSSPVSDVAAVFKYIETVGLIFGGAFLIYNTIGTVLGFPRLRLGGPEWEQGELF